MESELSFENYKIIAEIGRGISATVFQAIHLSTNVVVALKVIPKKDTNVLAIDNEVEIMRTLDHPFIAMLYEKFEDDKNIIIAMEYAEKGNLLDFINESNGLDEHTIKRIFTQLMFALDYIHNIKHIAHRDLKFENILLDRFCNIKLVDFGLSHSFTEGKPHLITGCGSLSYISPEMLNKKPYTVASDLWSAGVILYAMIVKKLPFYDKNMNTLAHLIKTAEPEVPTSIDNDASELITNLLRKDPNYRWTIPQVFTNKWINESQEFKILSAIDWKNHEFFVFPEETDSNSILLRVQPESIICTLNSSRNEGIPVEEIISRREKALAEYRSYVVSRLLGGPLKKMATRSTSNTNLAGIVKSPRPCNIVRPDIKRFNRKQKPFSVSPSSNMQRSLTFTELV